MENIFVLNYQNISTDEIFGGQVLLEIIEFYEARVQPRATRPICIFNSNGSVSKIFQLNLATVKFLQFYRHMSENIKSLLDKLKTKIYCTKAHISQ